MSNPPDPPALTDSDLERLQDLLDAVPEPLQPLDVSALDGFLCAVLLQPQRVPQERWLAHVADIEGRPAAAAPAIDQLNDLALRRHAEIERAIARRDWFDPWIFPLEGAASPSESVLPWVAGFAAASDLFPALMALEVPELVEPIALLFMHFPAEDLEDADELLAVIETLEPPRDLAEAVQDLVRALMLIADVTRPRRERPRPAGPRRPSGARRPGPAGRRRG